ncbi:MAG TPA: hypothetical protein ENI65_00785 [Gammaproteobacteria bacterium]|nr:hypothetical protein [Gammaproteobacteria bacterium]
MKFRYIMSMVLSVLAFSYISPAMAIKAGELKNLKILSHHFATSVTSRKRRIFVKKPSKSRYLILKMSARVEGDDSKVFVPDFVLSYRHPNGKEDRSGCSAICRAKSSAPGERGTCTVSKSGWIKIGRNNTYLIASFVVENDVDEVELHRLGGGEPVRYRIGSEHKYSVYIATNRSAAILPEIEAAIDAGGYQVVRTSGKLNKKLKGITIHYGKKMETQAREISQRLMTQLGEIPTVKKMRLQSDKDIVIWIGKRKQPKIQQDYDQGPDEDPET